jgi:septin family protein
MLAKSHLLHSKPRSNIAPSILVIGATNSGKTSFLDFLRTSLALPARKQRQTRAESIIGPTYTHIYPNYTSHYLETEMNDGERVGLTLWDSQGLEKGMVDLQLREMASFVEAKFEDTFNEEMKVVRSPGVQDTHIHCVFLILDPLRLDGNIAAARKKDRGTPNGTPYGKGNSFLEDQEGNTVPNALDEDLDLQVLRTLQGKTTVVPVISKADTITTAHMAYLKRAVWQSLKSANLDPLEGLGLDDDGDDERSEEGSEEESPVKATPENGHSHHNSKKFDERDEDNLLSATHNGNGNGIPRSETSHLSSPTSSSSSASSPSPINPPQHQPKPSTSSSNPPQYLPLSIISPDIHDPTIIGRRFPWGFADPYNPDHCDFVRLREAVFKEWRGELREASRELWYEGWRTSRLAGGRRGVENSEVGAAF